MTKRSARQRSTPYDGSERRRHKRYPVPCPVRLSSSPAGQAAGKTANVSDGGLLVAMPRQKLPAPGSLVDVLLRVPRTTPNTYMLEEFTSRARVVRHETSTGRASAALQFVCPLELAMEV
jgi:hypothetical protein